MSDVPRQPPRVPASSGPSPLRFLPFAFVGCVVVGGENPAASALWAMAAVGIAIAVMLMWQGRRGAEEAQDPLVARALAVATRLEGVGRGDAAVRLRRGAADLAALVEYLRSIGDLDEREAEARTEHATLSARAEAATDAQARSAWAEGARAAARRGESLAALRDERERASARVAAFEQRIKAIEVDLDRLAGPPGEPLLEDHLARLSDEVGALARAREEVGR